MRMSLAGFFLAGLCLLGFPPARAAVVPSRGPDALTIATPEWARTLRREGQDGKDWYVYDQDTSEGPAKPSVVSRALEALLRDRSRLPERTPPGPCRQLLWISQTPQPGSGLSVCKSDSDLFTSVGTRNFPAIRDGVQVLVGLLRNPRDLIDPRLVPWSADRVKRIEITQSGKTSFLDRQGVLWESPLPHRILSVKLGNAVRPRIPPGRPFTPELTITLRGIGDDALVVEAQGRSVRVSNRKGHYLTDRPLAEVARLKPGSRLTRP